jgi:hypothetical protein
MKTRHFAIILLGILGLPAASGQPTYTREVSRILQAKCQQCHRPNDIAPMELSTYEQAVDWAQDIKRVVNEGLMPPWKPVEGHGKFRDSFGLTAQEKQDLLAWIDGGTPQGEMTDMPEPLPVRGEWYLGEPHRMLQMPEAYTPQRGKDIYRCFVMDPKLTEDQFVSAMDLLPGNRKSVHHVTVYLDSTGKAEKLDAADPEPGYSCLGGPGTFDAQSASQNSLAALSQMLGTWTPGSRPALLPEGVGMFLSKDAKIVMQVHYYSAISSEADQTRLGLYFTPKRAERILLFLPLTQRRIAIPPDDPAAKVVATFTFPPLMDAKIISVLPHAHLLATDFKVEALRPDGSTESLIWIDKWDFNWQNSYTYERELPVAAGTRLTGTCTYNNTTSNPRNPSNPTRLVTWGENTEDEMCVTFVGLTFDNQERLGLGGQQP